MAKERSQQIKIEFMQGFPVFNMAQSLANRMQHDSFSVIPSNPKQYDSIMVMKWQLMMICYKAANDDPEKAEYYFNYVDYAKIFEYYTLNCAGKING